MPSPNLSEIITTTLRNRSGVLADNFSRQTALMVRLSKRGKKKTFAGGRSIVQELSYQANGTAKWYSGYEPLNISPSDVMTSAEFEMKQAAVAITISGAEMLMNSGPEAMLDLLEGRIDVAERTLLEHLAEGQYSDGTADGGRQVGGLQLIVSDTGLSTVGGINSSDYTFWRNQVFDFSANSLLPGPATIQTAMNRLFLQCSRNRDRPDLIVADNEYFRYYWESLQAHQRFTSTNSDMAAAGFENLRFMGSDVVFDGGQGGFAPSNHMYFLNTEYLYWRPHSARDMVPLDPDRYATNQDATVKLIGWAGNMTVSNRALQGVIVA